MKINWKNILFWIFLIIAIILLIWNVFGSTPSEFITIISIIFMLVLKIWSISDRQIKLETKFDSLQFNIKDSFIKIKEDTDLIKKKLEI